MRRNMRSGMSRRRFLGAAAAGVGAAALGASGISHAVPTPPNSNIEWDAANDRWIVYPIGDDTLNKTHPFTGIAITEDAYNMQWVLSPWNNTTGADVLLKSHVLGDPTTFMPFNIGDVIYPGGAVVWIVVDCVVEGEEFPGGTVYPTGHVLAGRTKMTEITRAGGFFGIAGNGATIKNLVGTHGFAFFLGTWSSGHDVIKLDNVHVIGLNTFAGFLCLGLLLHAHGGIHIVKNCTFTKGIGGAYDAGIAYIPFTEPDQDTHAELTNNYIDFGTTGLGSIGIEVQDLGGNYPGVPSPKSSVTIVNNNTIVNTDIGIYAGGFGSYEVSDNPISAKKIGLMLTTYTDEDSILAENNTINIDPTGSADFFHSEAAVYGFSFASPDIIGLNALLGSLGNSIIRDNTIGSAQVGVLLEYDGRSGTQTVGNLIENNIFTIAYPDQVHYVIHDSIWAVNPQGHFKVDMSKYPHFENNTIIHSDGPYEIPGYLQLENVDQFTLGDAGNTWTNVTMTPGSPVSNDMQNPHPPHDKAQGPDWEKILRWWHLDGII